MPAGLLPGGGDGTSPWRARAARSLAAMIRPPRPSQVSISAAANVPISALYADRLWSANVGRERQERRLYTGE